MLRYWFARRKNRDVVEAVWSLEFGGLIKISQREWIVFLFWIKKRGVDLELEHPKCQGCLYLGQVFLGRGCPASQTDALARPLNFRGWLTAHLQLSLLKNIGLPLTANREELNSMYLSDSRTLRSFQLNVHQMLSWRKKSSVIGGKRHAFLLSL